METSQDNDCISWKSTFVYFAVEYGYNQRMLEVKYTIQREII